MEVRLHIQFQELILLYDFVSDLELVDNKGITDKGILLLNKLEEAEA